MIRGCNTILTILTLDNSIIITTYVFSIRSVFSYLKQNLLRVSQVTGRGSNIWPNDTN